MISTVLAFLVAIGLLIVIHEYGHYRVARACGVKVLRFSVGFGRVLWRRQRKPGRHRVRAVRRCRSAATCACSTNARTWCRRRCATRPSTASRCASVRPSSRPAPAANLILAVLLYAGAHWIGVEEPKALLSTPAAGSAAERAGLRAGDWARAISRDGQDWTELRSMTDLRWELTQAVLEGEDVQLMLSHPDGHGQRNVRLALGGLDAREVDAQLMRRIGIGAPYSEAGDR